MIVCAVIAAPGFVVAAENPSQEPPADVPVTYQSVLQAYQGFSDQPVRPWREVVEEVGKRGGWRAYARESYEARQAESKESGGGAAQ